MIPGLILLGIAAAIVGVAFLVDTPRVYQRASTSSLWIGGFGVGLLLLGWLT